MGMDKKVMVLFICFGSILTQEILADSQPTNEQDDACAEKKCSPDGPAVRFPFMLHGKQPQHCGYNPSFNLSCDELNRTIIELPSQAFKFSVSDISYLPQSMLLHSLEPCFAKHLRDLDISTTPFHFQYPYYDDEVSQYTLFNCSSPSWTSEYFEWMNISCLDNHGYVYASPIYEKLDYLSDLSESCTKMYDTNLVPREILITGGITLTWSIPPQCPLCRLKNVGRYAGPIIGFILLAVAIGAIALLLNKMKQQKEKQKTIRKFLEDYAAMKATRYSYAEIKNITNDFKDKLGEGGYGNVFKGQISNKIFVAVKLLHNSTNNGEEFINEVGTMGTIHHVNVVRLLGFCADGYKRALVYEFLPNGSLDKFIFSYGQVDRSLGMRRLQDIAIGIARGIEYLHQGCEQRILHFDIKPHNILLDEDFNPKISDFGLAKLCEKGRSVISMTAARGTMGYIAPEVFSRHFGNVSYKSDIYSFGMLLLEMVGRRKNVDVTAPNVRQVYFPEWVYECLVDGEELGIQVEEDGEDKIAKKLALVGLWCIQWCPTNRPSISFVLQMLGKSSEDLNLPPNPFTHGNAMNPDDPRKQKQIINTTLTVISESE